MARKTRTTRRRVTNARRAHRTSTLLAGVLVLAGLVAATVGIIAWTMDRPEPQQLLAGQPTLVGRSPWFDQGSTIFVAPGGRNALPTAAGLGCTLRGGSTVRALRQVADPDVLGTRVVAQISLVPRVVVGRTGSDARITCSGPAMRDAVVWVLPTTVGPSRTPLALVIAGIALVGLAGLVDPRARGMRRGLG